MANDATLKQDLERHAARGAQGAAVAATVWEIARTAAYLSTTIADGASPDDLGAPGVANAQGEVQKRLDVIAHDAFVAAAKASPVAWLLSEEEDEPIALNDGAPIALAIDPLDGSSNISVNAAIGTIFSILPAKMGEAGVASFLQPGSAQLAAGYVIYGAQTQLALSLGIGVQIYALNGARQDFFRLGEARIGADTSEFAINASNYRHWPAGYRTYVDDCLEGTEGPLGKDYNMRWLAAVTGEVHRILRRGGIFMYPADDRKGYDQGRLRLVYECNPLAMLVTQAGGEASNGTDPLLSITPAQVHQRSGFCCGAANEMRRLHRYLAAGTEETSPLFGSRGLFRVQV